MGIPRNNGYTATEAGDSSYIGRNLDIWTWFWVLLYHQMHFLICVLFWTFIDFFLVKSYTSFYQVYAFQFPSWRLTTLVLVRSSFVELSNGRLCTLMGMNDAISNQINKLGVLQLSLHVVIYFLHSMGLTNLNQLNLLFFYVFFWIGVNWNIKNENETGPYPA